MIRLDACSRCGFPQKNQWTKPTRMACLPQCGNRHGMVSFVALSAGAASHLVLIGVDEQRLAVGGDHLLVDHHLAHVLQRRQLVHRVEQDLLQDRAQAARAGLARESPLGHRSKGRRAHLELDAFHQEQTLVLLDERVFRLGEDLDQRVLVGLLISAPKPIPVFSVRLRTIFSRPSKAPPQTNRMLVVSTWTKSWFGCLRPPCGGTEAMVPSTSFSSACCTPSPDTSRVMDGLSDLREILSISSI